MERIGYLVHDLNDAAVERRVRALSHGGASAQLAGFYRRERVAEVGGSPAQALRQTQDARLLRRALQVAREMSALGTLRSFADSAEVLMARNLEMLLLAARIRRPGQRLVYEALDVHWSMLRQDLIGSALRQLERRLLGACDLVLTSSPAYVSHYFRKIQSYDGPVVLAENKVLGEPAKTARCAAPPPGPPWRIGWFGMLRCSRTFTMLRELARAMEGQVEIVLAGRPVYAELPNFERDLAETKGFRYVGPYTADDLAELYSSVHFAWCIDYYQEGLNSSWCLPNRLYESIAGGCVPIALGGIETGEWLERNRVGLILSQPIAELRSFLSGLDQESYSELRSDVQALPQERIVAGQAECRALVNQLMDAV